MKKLLTFILIVGLTLVTGNALAQTATLKIGTHTPPKSRHVSVGLAPWCRAIEKDADGALKFQEFWGGQLSRAPEEIRACRDRVHG